MVWRGGGEAWGHSSRKEGVSVVLSAGVHLPAQSQLPALEPRALWPWLCEPLAFIEEVGRAAASFCSLAPLVAHPWPKPRSSGTLPLTVSLPLQSVPRPSPQAGALVESPAETLSLRGILCAPLG